MPATQPTVRIPKMTHHKGRGLARVRLSGRDVYLGKWGSPEAKSAYDRAIAESLVSSAALAWPNSRR